MSFFIVAILAGLVSKSAEAQEFNWFENTDQQVTLIGCDSSQTPLNDPTNQKKLEDQCPIDQTEVKK